MGIVLHKTSISESTKPDIRSDFETEEYKTRIELLCEIAEEASSITEVSKLLERILRVTRHTLSVSRTSLFLNDKENGGLQSSITINESDETDTDEVTPKELEIATWAGIHVTPLLISDLSRDIRFGQDIDKYADGMTHSMAAVPIIRDKNIIGVLEAVNRSDCDELSDSDLHLLKTFASTEALILLVSMALIANKNINSIALDHALLDGYRSTAEAWASTADVKDSYAYGHSRRVREYALMAANRLSLPSQELQAIEFGALLHDIGKIGIDSDILCKPGPLTDEEWKIMHEHSIIGGSVLGEIPFLKEAKNIVRYHHERYDGKGYPEKLKGEKTPLGARLVAVADAFDTMTTDHSYREALNISDALDALVEGIGTQFCPVAVEAFVSAFKKCDGRLPMEKVYSEIKSIAETQVEPIPDENPVPEYIPAAITNEEPVHGNIRLLVDIEADGRQLRRFREHLMKIEGTKIIIIGSSEEEGHSFLISVPQPLPLLAIIGQLPCVLAVDKKGKDFLITLKTA